MAIGLAPAKREKRLLNDVSLNSHIVWYTAFSISYYMGVGETSFNSRFTLLAGICKRSSEVGHGHRPCTCQESEAAVEWCFTNSHIVWYTAFSISYYMGVGETSFNSRFTLLAGARPMAMAHFGTSLANSCLIEYQDQLIHVKIGFKHDVPSIVKSEALRAHWSEWPICASDLTMHGWSFGMDKYIHLTL